jgi:hypothetical protein
MRADQMAVAASERLWYWTKKERSAIFLLAQSRTSAVHKGVALRHETLNGHDAVAPPLS